MVTDSKKKKYISKRHRQRPNISSRILSCISSATCRKQTFWESSDRSSNGMNSWWQATRLCKEKRCAASRSAPHGIRKQHLLQLMTWPCLIPEDNNSLAQQNIVFLWFVTVHANHRIPCRSWKTL